MTLPRISDAEWIVMEMAWKNGEFTASEAVEELASTNNWGEPTIKTMIRRLVEKGALKSEVIDGRRFRYRPRVKREDCARAQTKGIAERLFTGATSGLLVHLVRDTDLSSEDIAALRQVLAVKEKDQNKDTEARHGR
jgi:BlaI family transcriptional regulator, penicillinase repressor